MGNNFTTTPASPPADFGGMSLAEGRPLVRQFAKSGGDDTLFPDVEIDRAIQAAYDDFLHATRLSVTTTAASALVADTGTYALTVSGFLPFRLFRVWLAGYPDLATIPASELAEKRLCRPSTGRPKFVAFAPGGASFDVYPTPDDAATYTPTLEWARPIAFEAGTATPGAVDLSMGGTVPNDVVRTLLMYGAVAFLQQSYPEFKFAKDSYAKYTAFRDRMAGNVATEKSFSKRGAW